MSIVSTDRTGASTGTCVYTGQPFSCALSALCEAKQVLSLEGCSDNKSHSIIETFESALLTRAESAHILATREVSVPKASKPPTEPAFLKAHIVILVAC